MAQRTFVISECGSSWNFGLDPIGNAYRMIEAAKACDADAAKFQWTSNAASMAKRRGLGDDAEAMYRRYLQYPAEYLRKFKAHCDKVGIEFTCTAFIPQDLDCVSELAKRGKISAFESNDEELISCAWARFEELIISLNPGKPIPATARVRAGEVKLLHCISEYPTPIERLGLHRLLDRQFSGLSDHTTSVLTGALAVACGAEIVEKHIRLSHTPSDNPDYPHSLTADQHTEIHAGCCDSEEWSIQGDFNYYVRNIREAEKAL